MPKRVSLLPKQEARIEEALRSVENEPKPNLRAPARKYNAIDVGYWGRKLKPCEAVIQATERVGTAAQMNLLAYEKTRHHLVMIRFERCGN